MAYVSPELKAKLSPAIKAVLKKYNMKGTIAVRNHMTLVVNIKSGKLDILNNWFNTVKESGRYRDTVPAYLQVNEYHIDSNYSGKVKSFLLELKSAMMQGNHDNSDIQSDYFDVGWYITINVGQYDKPYIYEGN